MSQPGQQPVVVRVQCEADDCGALLEVQVPGEAQDSGRVIIVRCGACQRLLEVQLPGRPENPPAPPSNQPGGAQHAWEQGPPPAWFPQQWNKLGLALPTPTPPTLQPPTAQHWAEASQGLPPSGRSPFWSSPASSTQHSMVQPGGTSTPGEGSGGGGTGDITGRLQAVSTPNLHRLEESRHTTATEDAAKLPEPVHALQRAATSPRSDAADAANGGQSMPAVGLQEHAGLDFSSLSVMSNDMCSNSMNNWQGGEAPDLTPLLETFMELEQLDLAAAALLGVDTSLRGGEAGEASDAGLTDGSFTALLLDDLDLPDLLNSALDELGMLVDSPGALCALMMDADTHAATPAQPVRPPPTKKSRAKKKGSTPAASTSTRHNPYTIFIRDEIARLRQDNPGLHHKEALKQATHNWASFRPALGATIPLLQPQTATTQPSLEQAMASKGWTAAALIPLVPPTGRCHVPAVATHSCPPPLAPGCAAASHSLGFLGQPTVCGPCSRVGSCAGQRIESLSHLIEVITQRLMPALGGPVPFTPSPLLHLPATPTISPPSPGDMDLPGIDQTLTGAGCMSSPPWCPPDSPTVPDWLLMRTISHEDFELLL